MTSEAIDWQETLNSMGERLVHRGPDDGDTWSDPDSGIGFAHRRLAIIDLSAEGRQPMHSANGRYVICFNGEIYNFADLKQQLCDTTAESVPVFRGSSDTEILLAAIEKWGLEAAIGRCTGMFAFAVWDRKNRMLHLVRDRMGEKPLYYGWFGRALLFASELKAFRGFNGFSAEIDRDSLTAFMRFSYIPTPRTIFKGIRKLLPGTILTLGAGSTGRLPDPIPYWSVMQAVKQGIYRPFEGTDEEATERLDLQLRQAVRQQMVADVPLGAFLSGGIDSSAIVALMQAQSGRPVQTFTIGSDDLAYDESSHAADVARHLKTDHTELHVSAQDAMAVIPKLATLYDEPFADSSQIPTFLVSQLARQHVTVSLSGDGADELFGGYNRHVWGERIWRRIRRIPQIGRTAIKCGMTALSPDRWDAVFCLMGRCVGSRSPRLPGQKIHKLAGVIDSESPAAMYQRMTSLWQSPETIVVNEDGGKLISSTTAWPDLGSFAQEMMMMDQLTYLPDDILAKVDRAAMGVSLETRVPFLDHTLVEFAWTLPLEMKIRQGQGKWLLRQVLDRYVPRSLVERPKAGFGVPIEAWLRGPLKDWAEDLIDEVRLTEEGYLAPEPIRRSWRQHLAGTHSWQHQLWNVMMFQSWLRDQS